MLFVVLCGYWILLVSWGYNKLGKKRKRCSFSCLLLENTFDITHNLFHCKHKLIDAALNVAFLLQDLTLTSTVPANPFVCFPIIPSQSSCESLKTSRTCCNLSDLSSCSTSREMKKGNIGLAMGMLGKKLKSSMGGSVDYGLTGKDGVVHPSLAVRTFIR